MEHERFSTDLAIFIYLPAQLVTYLSIAAASHSNMASAFKSMHMYSTFGYVVCEGFWLVPTQPWLQEYGGFLEKH